MQAQRTTAISRRAASPQTADGAVAILNEIVAQLAERVELLETRERMTRAAVALPRGRHRSRS